MTRTKRINQYLVRPVGPDNSSYLIALQNATARMWCDPVLIHTINVTQWGPNIIRIKLLTPNKEEYAGPFINITKAWELVILHLDKIQKRKEKMEKKDDSP